MKYRFLHLILAMSFILGCHEGYIALWESGKAEPIQVFPYHISSLPAADQQALLEGIWTEDQLALARLLEDYLS